MDQIDIIETVIAILVFIVLRIILIKSVEKTIKKNLLQKTRGKIIKKIINLVLLIIAIGYIIITWGVDQSKIAVIISSVLAIVGVAFFAQWSILSNITSGLIIFFNHPVKLDDTITVMDKDYHIEGRVSDIGLFFVIIKTNEGEQITLPSNIFMQKMIKRNVD